LAVTLLVPASAAAQSGAPAAPPCALASGRDLAVFRLLDDAVLITAGGGPVAVCLADQSCVALAGDPARAAREVLPAVAGRVTSATGRWGKHLVLTRTIELDEGAIHEVLELARGRWRARRGSERGWLPWYLRLVAGDGRLLGITEMESDGAHATGRQLLAPPPPSRVVELDGPRPRRLLSVPANEELIDLLPLPGGRTVALVDRVTAGVGTAVIYHLGSGKPWVDRLPSPCAGLEDADTHSNVDALRIEGRQADDVYVALSGSCGRQQRRILAHFDGQRWTIVPGPPTGRDPDDLAVGPDGAVWVVADGALHRRAPNGEWQPIPVTTRGQPCRAKQVIARTSGDVMVSATCSPPAPPSAARGPANSFVFETRCPDHPLGLLGNEGDSARGAPSP
jgi:hypothetical protein